MSKENPSATELHFDKLLKSYLDKHNVIGDYKTQLIEEIFESYPRLEVKYQGKFKKHRGSF